MNYAKCLLRNNRTHSVLILAGATVALFFCLTPASALYIIVNGSAPVTNMGWPNGAEDVANLPGRLGYKVGGICEVSYFSYQCKDTAQFQQALLRFAAIRLPRIGLFALGSQSPRLANANPLLLIVHDRSPNVPPDWGGQRGAKPERIDWTFTIWKPERFQHEFSNPDPNFLLNNPYCRQPVPAPQIDVYLGSGGPIEWKKINIPENVHGIDLRAEAAPASAKNGGVARGAVFDMATYQGVSGAKVILTPRVERQEQRQAISSQADKTGQFELRGIPEGYYDIQVEAEGYAGRSVGSLDNSGGHAYLDFDALISRTASLGGIVVDEKGMPLSGVEVSARGLIGIDGFGYNCVKSSALTDANGKFELAAVPEGSTGLGCRAPTLHQQTSIFERYAISNKTWEKHPEIRIVMTGTGIIRGKVVDKDGNPPTRSYIVNIEAKGGSKVGSWGGGTQCKEGGAFEFSGVPPGEYVLTSQPNPGREDEASEPKPVVVTAGAVIDVGIVNDNPLAAAAALAAAGKWKEAAAIYQTLAENITARNWPPWRSILPRVSMNRT